MSRSKSELVDLLSASCHPGREGETFSGVSFDSRTLSKNELFVCLKGKVHGHEFLDKAMAAGAAFALVEDEGIFNSHTEKQKLILVEDTLKAFGSLAASYRAEFSNPLFAISGFYGKGRGLSL